MKSKGQQEIVGFVLIVVLVVIAMMVFLLISLRGDNNEEKNSLEVKNLLDSIMGYTTSCAIVFEPQYDTMEDLFKSAFESKTCSNLNKPALNYLNESLVAILGNLTLTESTVVGYRLDFLQRQDNIEMGILEVFGGNCSISKRSEFAQRNIISGESRLLIRLKLCMG
jgi:hypothetical protein